MITCGRTGGLHCPLLIATALFAIINAVQLAAQEPTPPTEPTLPPIFVRPNLPAGGDSQPVLNYGGYGNAVSSGNIPWSSSAITSDSTRVGSYSQPAWTTQRPFTTTRAYVLPEGTSELEQWARPTWNRGDPPEWRMLEEVALGLGCRVQLDLYERWNIEPNASGDLEANHEGVQIEMRYALADWDVIPFNPTLYVEWIERGGPQDKPDKFETKLLLSEELTPKLFVASNVILEQEVSDTLETEIGWNNAIATPLIERKLLAGIESEFSATTDKGSRGDPEILLAFGPSLQFRPTPQQFIDVVGLFGTTNDSYVARMYIVWGYQFGTRSGPSENYRGSAATRSD